MITAPRALRSLVRKPVPAAAATFLLIVIVCAIFAPFVAPHDPAQQNLAMRLRPPAWMERGVPEHILGTDGLGRDMLSRIIYGARVSMYVGFAVITLQALVGGALGLLTGYFGGRLETIVMRLADLQLAMPTLVLAIALLAVLGGGITNVILVLTISGWVVYARVIRSQTLSVREKEYVEAARAVGKPQLGIIFQHILPNVGSSLVVLATLELAAAILAEATLSFLGLGVKPPTPTWGGMVADGRNWMGTAWWISTFPGLAIFVVVLAINVVGDFLRDLLDPTLKHE